MQRVTIADFKKHTRDMLNKALVEPIIITRYDEEFILTKHNSIQPAQILPEPPYIRPAQPSPPSYDPIIEPFEDPA